MTESKQILRQGVLWEVLPGKSIDEWRGLRQPSLVPQYDGQGVLPLSVQEDFAARIARLKAEGRMPPFDKVLEIVKRVTKS
jgi:hypothetical protein